MYKNIILKCQDCNLNFDYTAEQQKFFTANGWNAPIRCPRCRARRKEMYSQNEEWRIIANLGPFRILSRKLKGFQKNKAINRIKG